DGLGADPRPALGQEVLRVAVADGEPEGQPHGVADALRREPAAPVQRVPTRGSGCSGGGAHRLILRGHAAPLVSLFLAARPGRGGRGGGGGAPPPVVGGRPAAAPARPGARRAAAARGAAGGGGGGAPGGPPRPAGAPSATGRSWSGARRGRGAGGCEGHGRGG